MLRKGISLVLLLGVLGVLASVVWTRWGRIGAPEATLAGRYATEQQWIVAEVAEDIVEMAAYAQGQRSGSLEFAIDGPRGEPPRATVSFLLSGKERQTRELVIREHIWSPQDYAPLGLALLQGRGLEGTGTAPSADEAVLAALTNLRSRVLETQNQRISARLRASIQDADAHEEAALLLGTLVLRESSGYFSDVRQLLCRMTAHLALARALRGEGSWGTTGRIADVVLAIGAGRTREALAHLEEFGDGSVLPEGQGAWVHALKLRITGDWRATTEPQARTLLEQLEYFRALERTLGPAAAYHFYETASSERVPDWAWVALVGDFGTEVGVFAGEGVEPELNEARDLWQRQQSRPLDASDMRRALSMPARRCVTEDGPQVIAWGTWAASLQRHVCHRALALDSYWRNVVALKERAEEVAADFDRQLGGFVLYPFAKSLRWRHGGIELESLGDGLRAAVATTAERPELVSASVWYRLRETTRQAVIRRRAPDSRPWFAPVFPRGTAYDAGNRLEVVGRPGPQDATLTVLRERDPWDHELARLAILEDTHGKRPTVQHIRDAFGSRAEYNLHVMFWMASVAEPRSREREEILENQCRLVADECIDLAYYLTAVARDDDAAVALRRTFDRADDRVRVANNSGTLVRYYFERGREDEALRVAEHAAGTGSAGGIKTMARLLEWQGRFPEAEEQHLGNQRRYEQTDGVLAFYRRMVFDHRQGSYQSKLQRLLPDTFPEGLVALDASALPPVPRDGVQLQEDSRLWDLKKGDIIVGLDGWRVHTREQYSVVRQLKHSPDMRLHVWRRGRYSEVAVRAMDRWLDTWFKQYP